MRLFRSRGILRAQYALRMTDYAPWHAAITAGRNHRWFAGNSKQSNDHRGKWL
jgi:hypothetical protein